MIGEEQVRREVAEISAIFDRIGADYDAVVPYFSAFAADLVRWRPAAAGSTVLDLCTGDGACLVPLSHTQPARLTGMDISARMLRGARTRCAADDVPVELVRADAHRMPFADGAFDSFYCALSWQFFARPDLVLAGLTRVAAPRARLTLSLMTTSRHTWPFLGTALAEYAPEAMRPDGPPRGVPVLVARSLRAASWQVDETTEISREFEFGDAAHWLAWQWSHTGRKFLESVPADRQTELRDLLLTQADSAHRRTGLRITQNVHLISAQRAEEL